MNGWMGEGVSAALCVVHVVRRAPPPSVRTDGKTHRMLTVIMWDGGGGGGVCPQLSSMAVVVWPGGAVRCWGSSTGLNEEASFDASKKGRPALSKH